MVELRLLGALDLRRQGGEPLTAVLAQPKRLALLAYLALAPEQSFCRRDSIAALLWPDQDQEHSRGSLRQALRFLRRELGDEVIRNRGEEEIGLDSTLLWCDAAVFKRAVLSDQPEEAARLYQGDLLPGFFVTEAAAEFDEWLEGERSRIQALAATALWASSDLTRARGAVGEAIARGRQALQLNPDDEAGMRRLLRLLDDAGDRAGAIAAYEQFAERLRKEHQAELSAETQRLIVAIRARSNPHAQITGDPAAPRESAKQPEAAQVPAARRSRRRSRAVVVVLAIVAVGGAVAAAVLRSDHAIEHLLTVAVLPIQELSRDSTRGLVAEAATDELITDLAQIASLRVINRRTMMLYRDSILPLDAIARGVGAGMLVTSTMEPQGEGVVLRVQAVNAGDPRAVWARNFSGARQELPGWLQEVARSVAEYARIELTGPEQASLARRRPVDPAAYELYAKGRWWWNKRGRENLFRAIAFFHQALDVEPTAALVWSGMADAYAQIGYGGFLPPEEAFSKAKAAARRALELDSTLAEPHAALGYSMMYFDWDWAGAEREFRRAISRTFSYATAHEWYGLFLAAMGRFPQAESEGRVAQELDPLSVAVTATRGWIIHYAGREDEALQILRAGVRTDPKNSIAQLYLGRVYQKMGQFDSATAHYLATGPLHSWIPTIAGEGTVAARVGRKDEARKVIRQLDSLASNGEYVTPYAVALVLAALGEKDSAFARLEQAYRERTHWLVWLNRDSRWQLLRGDPRFASLVRRIGLPE
jgi:DNA-binding SARP family transcriptional activator/TolB-like protein/Flp pilus assembly protein TadD